MAVGAGFSHGDEPPVRAEHLGWTRDKSTKVHEFRITLVNRHDRPVWFLFPHNVGEPLAQDADFKNYPNSSEQPFGGLRFDGKGGSIIQVEFFGRDGFDAFHVPAMGCIELEGLLVAAPPDLKDSEFRELVMLEAQELFVNGRTTLEKWLPYATMSARNAKAVRTNEFTNLDWDERRRDGRDDYPKEQVRSVRAKGFREWAVRFLPHGERAP